MNILRMIRIAYKKLKSSVYYDKTQLILRQQLVEWEYQNDIEKELEELSSQLDKEHIENNQYVNLFNEICSSIDINAFPKKLEDPLGKKQDILFNFSEEEVKIKEIQYFINMDIRGHILGVLWLMLVGYKIDKKIYEHSYGNRMHKNLISEMSGKATYSPYLFEPYYRQYENWRDKGLDQALEHLNSGQDIMILTMDLKRFFYSVDMDDKIKEDICSNYINGFTDNSDKKLCQVLTDFLFMVFRAYSEKCPASGGRTILPIGFLPSNVLSNWYLNMFDKAVCDGLNPIYYGRYVDDILIVDKAEKNSEMYKLTSKGELRKKDVISFILCQNSRWKGFVPQNRGGLLLFNFEAPDTITYRINPNFLPSKKEIDILLQNDKLKLFYFKSGEPDFLITCFKNDIAANASGFRRMPEDNDFYEDDYSGIYCLSNDESPNKFCGINNFSLNKYELSKFISKHLTIGGLIIEPREHKFVNDIKQIFNSRATIQFYDMWERILEIFVINNEFEAATDFVERVRKAVENICKSEDCSDNTDIEQIKETLFLVLESSICRAFSLAWGKKVDEALKKINLNNHKVLTVNECRLAYLKTKMMDKSVMPVFVALLKIDDLKKPDTDVNLTRFSDALKFIGSKWNATYKYYPYIVNMCDISMISALMCITKDNELKKAIEKECENENKYKECDLIKYIRKEVYDYYHCNYRIKRPKDDSDIIKAENFSPQNMVSPKEKKTYIVSVGSGKKSRLKIAVANVALFQKDLVSIINENPDRSYNRYKDIAEVVNAAVNAHADLLAMPEGFVPFEWLPVVAKVCAQNDLAVITGVEHIVYKKKLLNLTAVILPFKYKKFDYNCAHISFHLKNYFSPAEIETVIEYGLEKVTGDSYELYKWKDCYFPVYCCYELASIKDRAIFQYYADFLVAVEWNKDTNYYSNIIESLSRDIHCYCIQVNYSDYGDSRIMKPSKTEEKDILRTKGGSNSTVLVGEIDIGKLRSFQQKENNLRKTSVDFKTTPPEFDAEIAAKKIKGEKLV